MPHFDRPTLHIRVRIHPSERLARLACQGATYGNGGSTGSGNGNVTDF